MSEKKRVIVLEKLAPEGIGLLLAEGLEVHDGARWDAAELLLRIRGCHALIVGPAHNVGAELLQAGDRLEVVGRTGPGVSNVDVAEATRRGIVVADTPESNANATAEQALALVLACARDQAGTHAELRAGHWEPGRWAQGGVEVRGRALGLVGLGRVAPLVAETALALGMKVLTCDPAPPAERSPEPAREAGDDPGSVYAEADFIVVDAPDGVGAAGLVGEAEFARMKDGVRVVSLAEPGVVDQAAWVRAIESGKVAASAAAVSTAGAAGVDPLLARGDVLLTPRLEEATADARLRAGVMIAKQVAAVLRGEFASDAVNVPLTLVDDADDLMPYLGLSAQLGQLLVSLAESPVQEIEISYGGSFAFFDTRILTLGVLGGVLADRVEGRVNYVNAQSIADARGVTTREKKESDLPDFPRLMTVSAAGPRGAVSVAGTSLGPAHKPRLVRVFGEDVDIEPAPNMAFLRYVDMPGIGGKVGTLLGEWGVNIGHMSVGRGKLGPEAVMALTLDEPLAASQIDQLVADCGLSYARAARL